MESCCSVWDALVQSIAARIRASAYVILAHWKMELDRCLGTCMRHEVDHAMSTDVSNPPCNIQK